jgi:acylphosphatase
VKNGDMEIAMEGEMTFAGIKPEANVTIDIAGYDRIVESLQAAAKSEPEAAQYVPVALAIKGFGKTLPDGRIEWVVNGKPDGSVTVNGVMVKPADPVANDEGDDGEEEATP